MKKTTKKQLKIGNFTFLSALIYLIYYLTSVPLYGQSTDCPIPFADPTHPGAFYFASNNTIRSYDLKTNTNGLFTTSTLIATSTNSVCSDPINNLVYYCSSTPNADINRQLYAYDVFNDMHIEIDADAITPGIQNDLALAGITMLNRGVGSGAAAFENGSLYLGIERDPLPNMPIFDNHVYRIDFVPGSNGTIIQSATRILTSIQMDGDWGDFQVVDDFLYYASLGGVRKYQISTETLIAIDSSGAGNQIAKTEDGRLFKVGSFVQQIDTATLLPIGDTLGAIPAAADAAGCPTTSSIGNLVWQDDNADGMLSIGENGIPGIIVELYADINDDNILDNSDDITGDGIIDDKDRLAIDTTDANGNYLFDNVLAGDYIVVIQNDPSVVGSPIESFIITNDNAISYGTNPNVFSGNASDFHLGVLVDKLLASFTDVQFAFLPPPEMRLTKSISNIVASNTTTPGNVDITFNFIIHNNNAAVDLTNITLNDDLQTQLGSAFISVVSAPQITASTATTDPLFDASFDGTSTNADIFDGTSGLIEPGQAVTVEFTVTIDPNAAGAPSPIMNQAISTADVPQPGGPVMISDLSDAGSDPLSNNPGFPGDTGGHDDPLILQIPTINTVKNMSGFIPAASGIVGNVDATFDLIVENTGNVTLTNLTLVDDLVPLLGSSYVGVTTMPSFSGTATTLPTLGSFPAAIFEGNDGQLDPGQIINATFVIEINPNAIGTPVPLLNQSFAGGLGEGPSGIDIVVNDASDAGTEPEGINPGYPGDTGGSDDPLELYFPQLHVSKRILSTSMLTDGNNGLNILYEITIQNTGNTDLTSISLIENFSSSFGAAFIGLTAAPIITASTAASNPTLNGGYNGAGSTNIFIGTDGLLQVNETITIQLSAAANTVINNIVINLLNQAEGRATGEGINISDLSDDGTIPESNNPGAPSDTGGSNDPTSLLDYNCSGLTFYDDGLENGNYSDDLSEQTATFCPTDPDFFGIMITFHEFDIAEGDEFRIHNGRDTNSDYVSSFGTGVSNSPNGGWYTATCENTSGCMTVLFDPNGDNRKGAGWNINVTCVARPYYFDCPEDDIVSSDCSGGNGIYIPPLTRPYCDEDFEDNRYFVAAGYYDPLTGNVTNWQEVNGINVFPITNGMAILEYGVWRSNAGIPSGATEDVNNDNMFDKYIGPGTSICRQKITVSSMPIICNDYLNVSLDRFSCELLVTPDMVLENICPGTPDNIFQITIDNGFPGFNLVEGTGLFEVHILDTQTGSACITTLDVSDNAVPVCNRILEDKVRPCTEEYDDIFEDISISNASDYFNDCSEIVEILSIDEEIDFCGDRLTWTDPWTAQVYLIVKTVSRTWYAVDENGDQTILGCNQTITIVRPQFEDIFLDNLVVLQCGQSADPSDTDLRIPDIPYFYFDFNGDGILSNNERRSLVHQHESCGYSTTWEDSSTSDLCSNGEKFTRDWFVIDWCINEFIRFDPQIVQITDTGRPNFIACPNLDEEGGRDFPIQLNTEANSCGLSNPNMLPPGAEDSCDEEVDIYMIGIYQFTGFDRTIEFHWTFIGQNFNLAGELPCGSYYALYRAEDECGNTTLTNSPSQWAPSNTTGDCRIFFDIEDRQPPTAACNDELQVSIANGSAFILASDIDEGSNDACGISSIQVRRSENDPWANEVEITCDDLHQTISIYLGVWDNKGNFNQCWVDIIPEDKLPPICTNLEEVDLSCDESIAQSLGDDTNGQWLSDPDQIAIYDDQFGSPDNGTADNCSVQEVEQEYQIDEFNCGAKTITRRFRAVDWPGNTSSYCFQNINVSYQANWEIIFPADWKGECIDAVPDPDISIINGSCDLIAWTHEDEIFTVVEDACFKVVRTYNIINWCSFDDDDLNNPVMIERILSGDDITAISQTISSDDYDNIGVLTYTQILKVTDNIAPAIEINDVETCLFGGIDEAPFNTEDITPGTAPFECDTSRVFSATGRDCSEAATAGLQYFWEIYEDGIFTGTGSSFAFTWTVQPKVTYTVVFIVQDNCGNVRTAERDFEFWDCKSPTPYCLAATSVAIMPTGGSISIWGSDVDLNSFDNCTAQENLEFRIWHESLEGEYTQPTLGDNGSIVLALPQSVELDCDYIGLQSIDMYVIDEEGNWDFCSATIDIQDNSGICPGSDMIFLGGNITTESGFPVSLVEVNTDGTGDMQEPFVTGTDGNYHFSLSENNNYSIIPEKDINPLNGVSTFDLVLIQQHILQIDQLSSPYQWIAADINHTNTISVSDVVQLRQIILGILTDFPTNTSWRFVDADYSFTTNNPLTEAFPEVININNLENDTEGLDFVAVKIGDVNGNVIPSNLVSVEDRKSGVWNIYPQIQQTGLLTQIDFYANDLVDISGYQFGLSFDTDALEFQSINYGVAQQENVGLQHIEKGMITLSWNGETSENRLFSLIFNTKKTPSATSLQISSAITIAEAYHKNGQWLLPKLVFDTKTNEDQAILYQNTPNPFIQKTALRFYLPQPKATTLRIIDISGKIIFTHREYYESGEHLFNIDNNLLPEKGLYYYQIITDDFIAMKKMVNLN